jgi:hypothetical protein
MRDPWGDAKVRRAAKALRELDRWLKTQASAEFFEWHESEYDTAADLGLRPFWTLHDLF